MAFVVYWLTLAPGLTWRNDGADGGDLLTAVYTLGVPHPSGYPTYVLLGQLFARLPWGDPACRLNLMSAVAMSLAVGLLAGLIHQVLWLLGVESSPLQSLISTLSALALAFSPILWSQATITEVYALHAAFTAGALWLSLRPGPPLALLSLIFGLGLGNHLSLLLLLPGLFVLLLCRPSRSDGQWRFSKRRTVSPISNLQYLPFAIGLLVYLYLPWASARGGVTGWPAATTPEGFWWLVSGAAYRHYLFGLPADQLLHRLAAWVGLLVRQTTPVGFTLALLGVGMGIRYWRLENERLRALSTISLASLVTFLLYSLYAITYNTADSYVFLIPALLIWAIWLAVGAAGVAKVFGLRGPVGRWAGPALLGLILVVNLAGNWAGQDLSRDREAADFGQAVMTTVAADAVVLTNSDRHTFALWYYGQVGHPRPDVLVIDRSLLQFDWHRREVARSRPALAPALAGAFEDLSDRVITAALERYAVYVTEPDPDLSRRYLLQKEGPVWHIARPVR